MAVGCIFAGDGDGGAGVGTVTGTPDESTEELPAALVALVVLFEVGFVGVLLWFIAAAGCGGAITAVAVPVGAVAIPALRMF